MSRDPCWDRLLDRLVSAVRHMLQIVFRVFGEVRLDSLIQLRLVVFYGQHEVALRGDNLLGDFFLAPHRVNGDDCTLHVDLVE